MRGALKVMHLLIHVFVVSTGIDHFLFRGEMRREAWGRGALRRLYFIYYCWRQESVDYLFTFSFTF